MTIYDTEAILSLISERPMTVKQIAEQTPRSCKTTLCCVLNRMEERGEVRKIGFEGRAIVWEACR